MSSYTVDSFHPFHPLRHEPKWWKNKWLRWCWTFSSFAVGTLTSQEVNNFWKLSLNFSLINHKYLVFGCMFINWVLITSRNFWWELYYQINHFISLLEIVYLFSLISSYSNHKFKFFSNLFWFNIIYIVQWICVTVCVCA